MRRRTHAETSEVAPVAGSMMRAALAAALFVAALLIAPADAQEASSTRERARSSARGISTRSTDGVAQSDATRGSAIADLVVTIAVGTPSSGADTTYDVRVANVGPSTATGVTLALTAAADTVFVAPPGASRGFCSRPPRPTCDLGTIEPGEGVTVTTVLTVPTDAPALFSATATAAEFDPNTRNNTAVVRQTRLGAPSDLVAGRSGHQIVLRWKDNSGAESEFQVERSTNAGAFRVIGSVKHGVTTFHDRMTGTERAYTYRVRAVNARGASDYSSELTFTLAAHGALHLSRSALSFHGVRAGSAEVRTLAVRNTGSGPLSGVVTPPAGAFTIASGDGAYTLAPGGSKTITVRFAPTSAGHATGSIIVTSDDPKRQSLKVTLSGVAR